jgi:hypothetical protein
VWREQKNSSPCLLQNTEVPTVIKCHVACHTDCCVSKQTIICNARAIYYKEQRKHCACDPTACSNWQHHSCRYFSNLALQADSHGAGTLVRREELLGESLNCPHFMELDGSLTFHNSLPVVPNLPQINPVQILPFCFFQLYFSIILSSTPRSNKRALSFRLSHQECPWNCFHVCYRTDPSQPPSFDKNNTHQTQEERRRQNKS